jgi:hypothetical protein
MTIPEQDEYATKAQGPAAALDALTEVSHESDILADFRSIAGAFTADDYRAIIDLAWRHQFNAERLNFKRELRALQEHVCSRIILTSRKEG